MKRRKENGTDGLEGLPEISSGDRRKKDKTAMERKREERDER